MTGRRNIEIIFAHPALEKSRVNKVLIAAAREVDGITVHDLYETYPDMYLDVAREQALLSEHDLFVFHHPFYWYAAPSLLKEWMDLVLTHGWAYGHSGTALRGKMMFNAITTGGAETAYSETGYNRFTMRQFLAPMDQTAHLCGVEYLPPFVVHGTHSLKPAQIEAHAIDYARYLTALRDDLVDMNRLRETRRANEDLAALLRTEGEG